jgi:isocitrate dehydrogenase (NAD+)
MLLSGVMLLRHVGLNEQAGRLEKAIHDILLRGKVLTRDVGGFATTKEFTKAVINHL